MALSGITHFPLNPFQDMTNALHPHTKDSYVVYLLKGKERPKRSQYPMLEAHARC